MTIKHKKRGPCYDTMAEQRGIQRKAGRRDRDSEEADQAEHTTSTRPPIDSHHPPRSSMPAQPEE